MMIIDTEYDSRTVSHLSSKHIITAGLSLMRQPLDLIEKLCHSEEEEALDEWLVYIMNNELPITIC